MKTVTWLCLMGVWSFAYAADFVEHRTRFSIGPNPTSILAVDLNDDGFLEILTTDAGRLFDPREEVPAQNQVSILKGAKGLAFQALPQLRTGFAPYGIVAANMDALKAPDLLVGNFLASRNRDLSLFRNVGDDIFETYHFSVSDEELDYLRIRDGDSQPLYTRPGITSVIVDDFDGDGYRDAVATGWSSDQLILFPGVDEGYLGTAQLFSARGGPRDIEVADFDGDRRPDLAVTMYSANEIALWKNDRDEGFIEVERFPSRGHLPQKIEVADMNGDAKPDLIVSHRHADDSVVIFYGEGEFKFGLSQELRFGESRGAVEYEIVDLVAADLNDDKRPDLVVVCRAMKTVIVLLSTSKTGVVPLTFKEERYVFEDGEPAAACVGDFDRDGQVDIAVALDKTHEVVLLLGKE